MDRLFNYLNSKDSQEHRQDEKVEWLLFGLHRINNRKKVDELCD